MDKKSNIEKLFKDQFENFEVEPSADLWSNIQSGINSNVQLSPDSTSLASKTMLSTSSYWASTIIVGAIITGTIVGGYFYFENKTEENKLKSISEKVEAPLLEEKVADIENPILEKEEISSTKEPQQNGSKLATATEKEIEKSVLEENNIENKPEINVENSADDFIDPTENNSHKEIEVDVNNDELAEESTATAVAEDNKESISEKTEESLNLKDSEEDFSKNSEAIETNKEVKTKEELIAEELKAYQFPNIFTPNQDGITDIFEIDIESEDIDAIEVAIFDRTSNLIKSWKTFYGKWDGTLANGDPAPTGPYFYQIILTKDGVVVPRKGIVTLNR